MWQAGSEPRDFREHCPPYMRKQRQMAILAPHWNATGQIHDACDNHNSPPSQAKQPAHGSSYYHARSAPSRQSSSHRPSNYVNLESTSVGLQSQPNNLPQLDGPYGRHQNIHVESGFRSQRPGLTSDLADLRPASNTNGATGTQKNLFQAILPFCTAEGQLTESQLVGLSDLAGSLKEVMLLALQARTDSKVGSALVSAVGEQPAMGIVEYFTDEYEV